MVVFPNAKINLGLNVVKKRDDGFHDLETVFYPISLCDVLEIVKSDDFDFQTTGITIDAPWNENIAVKAYNLLKSEFNLPPVNIHLHKVIPFGAGLGGGSSDAAFMIKALNQLFQLNIEDEEMETFASFLGSDCAFFIKNKPAIAFGKGNLLSPIPLNLSNYTIVVVKPAFSVNTATAYQNIKPQESTFHLTEIANIPVEKWEIILKNDFEQPVFKQHPQIGKIKNKLYEKGAVYSAMSGSGSAVFGIFSHSPINIEKSFPESCFIYR